MSQLMTAPPVTPIEAFSEVLHGIPFTDPYRWLEDQESPRTRKWIEAQQEYARSHLDTLPGRNRIRSRVRELLDVETYDSMKTAGSRYFFRKRLRGQEQPCIFFREGLDGKDELLVDPAQRATGQYTAVKPLQVSHDGGLLLYEVKQGGERTGTFEILDVDSRKRLPEQIQRGYLRGFAFAPDGKSFFYVHDTLAAQRPVAKTAYEHILGTPSEQDRIVFRTEESNCVHLTLLADRKRIIFAVYHFHEKKVGDFYLKRFCEDCAPRPILMGIESILSLQLMDDRILALTSHGAPNRRVVEIAVETHGQHDWVDVVPECEMVIHDWLVAGSRIFVSYAKGANFHVYVFDLCGTKIGEVPSKPDETVRLVAGVPNEDDVLLEIQSFVSPVAIFRYSAGTNELEPFAAVNKELKLEQHRHLCVQFPSNGTAVPMFLVGRSDVLAQQPCPVVMTAYGGFGKSMTPQFSIFVTVLMELGCLFALPNIRGGLELGVPWHEAAKRRNRPTAVDDFLCAAQWLIKTGRTTAAQLAIFGGSNSGLLVGAALVRRPDLFAAAICIAPLLDMLRYHLFDSAALWKDEFGTADDFEDFLALCKYSPYQLVEQNVAYPAVMLISGDADQNCNPMHARKMTARLQKANKSTRPIILDYHPLRGHSAVLPFSTRIEALTDRLAFLSSQLHLPLSDGDRP